MRAIYYGESLKLIASLGMEVRDIASKYTDAFRPYLLVLLILYMMIDTSNG